MFLFRSIGAITSLAIVVAAVPAFGDSLPARVRGTVTAVNEHQITVNEPDGRSLKLGTTAATSYADLVPSSLAEIKVNDYIGSAVKGTRDHLIAVEIALVPQAMRPGRIGYYPWDRLPDTSGMPASGVTDTTMTNGLVSEVSPNKGSVIRTEMTNGIVTARHDGENGRTLTVDLVDDGPAAILVSPTTPIVRFVPSNHASVTVGSTVVIWTQPGNLARLVAVGKGVHPPM